MMFVGSVLFVQLVAFTLVRDDPTVVTGTLTTKEYSGTFNQEGGRPLLYLECQTIKGKVMMIRSHVHSFSFSSLNPSAILHFEI